jgi:predicted ABC-type ATPase
VVVLGGPNGAGKTTAAAGLLPGSLKYLNADEIAKGLPSHPSSAADLEASRILIDEMDECERLRESFAVETTLASRSLAPRMARLRSAGYFFRLVFIWSPSVDFSIQRVAARVRSGGHSIPEETIRRRYAAGLRNFFGLYRPLADIWDIHDNLGIDGFRLIAEGGRGIEDTIHLAAAWNQIEEAGRD